MNLTNTTKAFIIYFFLSSIFNAVSNKCKSKAGGATSMDSALASWLCSLFSNVIIYSTGFFFLKWENQKVGASKLRV